MHAAGRARSTLTLPRFAAQPVVPASLSDYLVGAYLGMREEGSKGRSAVSYVSARSLLALVRVATALARLRLRHAHRSEEHTSELQSQPW